MEIIIFLIIVIVLSLRSAAKQNARPNRGSAVPNEPRKDEWQQSKIPEERPQRRIVSERSNRMSQRDEDDLTEIERRRVAQHEASNNKSRIHQNIHKEDNEIFKKARDLQEASHEVGALSGETRSFNMKHIKELIVCGYPTELKNQRDFVKEGEDFLASLTGSNEYF